MSNTMKIGLNVFGDKVAGNNEEMNLVTDGGALIDFAVCHVEGRNYTLDQAKELARRLSQVFEKAGVDFITNFEYANWSDNCTAADGTQWAYDEEGCHRVALPDGFVFELCKSDRFKGIMYDEFEHIVLNRNPTIQISSKMKKIIPVFPLLKTRDAVKQGEKLTEQLKGYADSFFSRGIPAMMGEHNYPVLLHKFAQSGITPNYKSLKENLSNVAFAMASGAALQYDLPLYNCADCWYMLTNPGHTPEEMYYNLVFAYNAGVDSAYVESVNVMTENGALTPHGEAFRRFCTEYKSKERGYSSKDYRPEIGIINYDDGFWGQWYPIIFKKCLLSNPKLKPDYRSREIFKAFNIITHGETCKNGFSWGRFSLWSLKKHFSFVSMNSTAVFDHNADEKVLSSLKLCFLTGIHISEKTLTAVKNAVNKNGMTAVTPRRFAPKEILSSAKGMVSEIPDGNGKWIVIKGYRAPGLKKRVKEYLGKKGEMRFTFTNGSVTMKIGKDKKSFTVV
ncbi:MAG: hypothetical protein MJ177_00385 [Clostridia bacterium]|nr:hypothetical protein [Clostridia bacterium]